MDKVHVYGMTETDYSVSRVYVVQGPDYEQLPIEPPIDIVYESDKSMVALVQDGLAARYNSNQLSTIGDGSSMLGIHRILVEVALNGSLEHGATKPLHPSMVDTTATG